MNARKKEAPANSEVKPSYRWVILTLSWLLYFAFGLIDSALSVLVTTVMTGLSLTYSQMGIILGSWQLVYIFFAQPAGLLIDYLGSYKSLFLGATIISLSAALRGIARNFESLLVFVALFGLGGPMISIGLPKLTSAWFIGRERGIATGVFTTGNAIGSIVALSITNSVMMPIVGTWNRVFLAYSLMGLMITLLWLSVGRRSQNSNEVRTKSRSLGEKNTGTIRKQLLQSRNVWFIVIIGVTSFLAGHGLPNWLPKILELKGMTAGEAGAAVSFLQISGIAGSLLIPRLPYTLGSKKLAISLTLVTLGIAILILGVESGPIIWLAMMVAGATMRGLLPLLMVTLMDLPEVDSKQMGAIGGLYFSIGEIGGFGGPVVMGLLKDVTGSFIWGIIFIAAVTEAAIIFAALLDVDNPKRGADSPREGSKTP